MKNIHVIPTDKPSRLQLNKHNKIFLSEELKLYSDCINQNIYITSDEEIKEGWSGYAFKEDVEGKVFKHFYTQNEWYKDAKKIILTDNQDLIKDGVQAIEDDFLEWFVNNPSCEEIFVNTIEGFDFKLDKYVYDYKIIIPKKEPKQHVELINDNIEEFDKKIEEFKHSFKVLTKEEVMEGRSSAYEFIDFDKQETLEETAERYVPKSDKWTIKEIFIDGAKWNQERSYSEEDMVESFMACWKANIPEGFECKLSFKEWFKQFKKK